MYKLFDYFPRSWRAAITQPDITAELEACWQAVQKERAQGIRIYPDNDHIFAALAAVAPEHVRVVILGQDPYHQAGQAHGFAFSVPKGIKVPPSLRNMYKALAVDYPGFKTPEHGCLTGWAEQGVLLLNTVFTVRDSAAGSHQQLGWQTLTQAILKHIAAGPPVVFMLWGKHAQNALKGIDTSKHCVLTGVHPSPLSAYRGFFEQEHFRKANDFLTAQGKGVINWSLA
ncbi:uracil-DNA glycosylase [Aliidiomarina taiwanensis]|uniref:Uracil-DNA glycosylase n=1 Tax=Aliidiomarina taiwanensis TaxID=946228 RepID=A0A432X7Y4_9GAMM|nr:uracil-DNA glycosylase [Aliidiomarina taiwanensis]RUO42968.1 uracil-DNA glycosylase [Aliidiomarina taiwanensis]